MAGDDEIHVSASGDGDLADFLRRIEERVESLEDSLKGAGRTGERAGESIESGADKAAEGLRRAEKAADDAADDLEDVAARGRSASDALDDVGDNAEQAGVGLRATEKGAEGAAEALGDTAREARQAARALDDAGDEAAESGAQAASAIVWWERLAARIDRGERFSRRWSSTQNAMRWSNWSGGMSGFASKAKSFVDIDWDKAEKKLGKLSKTFGGFSKILMLLKVGVVVSAVYALLGAVSALGAGAVGAVGGLATMVPAIGALAGVALVAKLAMIGIKGALKESQPEVDALKKKFEGFSTNIAAGGLRKGLKQLTADLTPISRILNLTGTTIGEVSAELMGGIGTWLKGARALNLVGVIADHVEDIYADLGWTAFNVGKIMLHGLAASMPAAMRLSGDVANLTTKWSDQAAEMYDSGRMTQVVSQAYENLRRALGVVADWVVGLFRIFRIGAQESAWMGDSIEASAQKFRDWTGSLEGQNSIRDYFVNAMPAVREAGLLIRDIFMGFGSMAANQDLAPLLNQIRTQLLPAIIQLTQQFNQNLLPGIVDIATKLATMFAGLDFSGLGVLVLMINKFLDAIIWAQQNVPGFNFILSTLLTTLFLLGPAFKIGEWGIKVFGQMGTVLGWLAKVPGIKQIVEGFRVLWAVVGGGPGILKWIGGRLISVAMWIGRGLAAAFLGSNPIGWIILAVIAVVAIFWWLWDNCAWFRDGVKMVLAAVGQFFVDLWNWAWPVLQSIGGFFVWLWGVAVEAWGGIVAAAQWAWENVLLPVLSAIWTGLKVTAAILFVVFVGPFLIAWNLISALAVWVWNSILWPLLQAIGAGFSWIFTNVVMPIVDFFVWAWNAACLLVQFAYYAYIVPALTALGEFFGWIFNSIIMPVVNFFVALWNAACLMIQFAYYAYIVPALNALGAMFAWIFNSIIMPVVNFFVWLWNMACATVQLAYLTYIVPMINAFAAIINWLYVNIWTPILNGIMAAWNWLCGLLTTAYYSYIVPMFTAFSVALGVLRGWFDSTVAGIGAVWNGLRSLLAKPVNFLINTVWNNGIVKAWNWAASMLGLAQAAPMQGIPEAAEGAIMPGRATPGRDTMLAAVGGREAVMRSEFTDAVGDARIYRWNYLARTGGAAAVREDMLSYWEGPRFASGGIMSPTQAGSGPLPDVGSAPESGTMGDWARSAIAEITDPLINMLPGPPPEWLGVLQAFPRKIRDNFVDWVVKKFDEMMSAFGGGVGGAIAWAPAIAMALAMKGQPQNLNPVVQRRMNQESGGNPVAVNLWDSNAKKGTPSVGLMQVIGPTYRSYADRRRDVGPYMFGTSIDPLANILASMGYAMSRYGSLAAAYNKSGGYDSGGWLQPGYTLAYNGTGHPEPVFTSGQWGVLQGLTPFLDGGAGLAALYGTDNLVAAMQSTPQNSDALVASRRDAGSGPDFSEIVDRLDMLTEVIAERPPAMSVASDEIERAVRKAWDDHARRERTRRRYTYGG